MMKILKPGKIEMRKFVCPRCGCVFVARFCDTDAGELSRCPEDGCTCTIFWDNGEPYEEPTPTRTDKERLTELLDNMGIFLPKRLANYLIRNGVTFREDAP